MAVRAVVTDTSFDVTLSGWDMVWALRRHVSIPFDQITGARVIPRKEALRELRWRLGGTHLPGVVTAGHYSLRNKEGRALASIYRDDEVLEVTTTRWRPRIILLQHPDRHDLAWYLGERIG
jgi:hypothetical protein